MQAQHRPTTRAPHGDPIYTEPIAFKGTKAHKRAFQRNGGSGWLRNLIDRQRQHEEVIRKAQALLDDLEEDGKYLNRYATELQTAIRKVQA